jgi:alpha-N-arabinofuranosidase
VTSTFEYLPGLPVHRSRDLVNWEPVGHVVDRVGMLDYGRAADSGGLYAPTIRHDGQRFYVVCTLVTGGERQGNFVTVAERPWGPWSDPVWWEDTRGIDPSLFFDGDDAWCLGTRLVDDPEYPQQTEVWLRRFDKESLTPVGAETILWNGALRGAIWAEGPHLYRRGDHVLLIAAEGGTERHHAVVAARADAVTGPYRGNPANPILTHRHLGRTSPVTNVGHADLIDLPDGSSWAVMLATRPVDGADVLGRETFLAPVVWEDGWPVIAPGVGSLEEYPPTPEGALPSHDTTFSDDFTGRLHHRWISPRALPASFTTTSAEGLVFISAGSILHRVTETRCHAEALVEGDGGLVLRYSDANALSVVVTEGHCLVTSVTQGREDLVARVAAAARSRVEIALEGTVASVALDGTVLAQVPVSHLCASASGGFVGLACGPTAQAPGTRIIHYRYTARDALAAQGGTP